MPPKKGFGPRSVQKKRPKGSLRFGKRGGASTTSKSGKRVPAPTFSKEEKMEQQEQQQQQLQESEQEIPGVEKKFGEFLEQESPRSEQQLQQAGAFRKGAAGAVLRDAYAKMLNAKAQLAQGKKPINIPKPIHKMYVHATAMVKTYAQTQGYLQERISEHVMEAVKKMGGEILPSIEGSNGKKYPRVRVGGKVYCGHPIVQGWGASFTSKCKHAFQEQSQEQSPEQSPE